MRRALILALSTGLSTAALMATATHAAPARHPAAKAPAVTAAAQADPTISPKGWAPPKNAFGQPDLSGYWANATLTPMTRSRTITAKPSLTAEEAHKLESVFIQALADDDKPTPPSETTQQVQAKFSNSELLKIRPDFAAAGGDVGGYNVAWIDPGTHIMEVNGEYRTSILTTPDGQVPKPKTGVPRRGFGGGYGRDSYDSYETRSIGERCIMGFGRNAGPPMLPNGYYNNDYYIIQTPDYVAIQVELIHDTRIVRLKGGHRTDGIRPWMGDSIGHWEGNTLVVETTNIPEREAFMGSWKNLKITERFTRVSPTRINYQFQVEDPDTWDQPWGGEYDFYPMKGIIYEYACHEGNYALPSILAGARRQEKEAAAAQAAKAQPGAITATPGKSAPAAAPVKGGAAGGR